MSDNREYRREEIAYILDADDLPAYIGEGLGDYDYKSAIDFSIIRRTNRGLPATKDYIMAITPPPRKLSSYHTSRASKNNPYRCPHCDYKTTRYSNMVSHLHNSHDDYFTDPRDNR